MSADSATLKLDNQKNGWHGIRIHHKSNGDEVFDPVCALGRRVLHIREHTPRDGSVFLSAVFHNNMRRGIMDKDIRVALKLAVTALEYPTTRNIPVDCIEMHFL